MQRYLAIALDPIHPGAGGYRLGRVDNTIAREPGSNLPKAPGTGLHGATKAYAAIANARISCAGNRTCHRRNCPICYTFGATEVDDGSATRRSYKGVVRFTDAEIVLFPVSSMYGPVWVTTSALLRENFGLCPPQIDPPVTRDQLITTLSFGERGLNLGGLLFTSGEIRRMPASQLNGRQQVNPPLLWSEFPELKEIQESVVIVDRSLFSQIVNANLEVRTSVVIDPETGAAAEGLLFTYEAIPRAAFLTFSVGIQELNGASRPTSKPPQQVVIEGLRQLGTLGIGGMGTRGFGRLHVLNA